MDHVSRQDKEGRKAIMNGLNGMNEKPKVFSLIPIYSACKL